MSYDQEDISQVFIEYLEATGQLGDFERWIRREKNLGLEDLGIDVWDDDEYHE